MNKPYYVNGRKYGGFIRGTMKCATCGDIKPAVLMDAVGNHFCSAAHADALGVKPFDWAEGLAGVFAKERREQDVFGGALGL